MTQKRAPLDDVVGASAGVTPGEEASVRSETGSNAGLAPSAAVEGDIVQDEL